MMNIQDRTRRAGYTMLELMVGLVLGVSMLASLGLTTSMAMGTYKESQANEEIDALIHRTLDVLARDFEEAGRGGLTPDPSGPLGADGLTYRKSLGYAGGTVVWSNLMRVDLELEPGEIDDGIDNNGNGLADERMVVWRENPGQPNERRVVRCHFVSELLEGEVVDGDDDNGNGLTDESGLSFSVQGDVLTIRMTLERNGPAGRLITRTARTSVRLRNP